MVASDVVPGGNRVALFAIGCALLAPTLLATYLATGHLGGPLVIPGFMAWVSFLIVSMILASRSRKLLPRGARRHALAIVATVVSYVSLAWLILVVVMPFIVLGD